MYISRTLTHCGQQTSGSDQFDRKQRRRINMESALPPLASLPLTVVSNQCLLGHLLAVEVVVTFSASYRPFDLYFAMAHC